MNGKQIFTGGGTANGQRCRLVFGPLFYRKAASIFLLAYVFWPENAIPLALLLTL
jgi:hypothetical protein